VPFGIPSASFFLRCQPTGLAAGRLGHLRDSARTGQGSRLEMIDDLAARDMTGREQRTAQEASCARPNVGAGEGTRTPNLLFTRQLRYRLRHTSMTCYSPCGRTSSR
jgi:hypothetical protein